jgi:hypothetical protein
MATFRVDDFKSKLVGGGARPNLFRATINFPSYAGGNSELTSFMCKAAQLPSSVIAQIDVPFRGRQLKIAGDRTFENWNITVIQESSMEVRNSFERWLNGINEHVNGTGLVNPVDYQADMLVEQLDRNDNVIKSVNIRGAFPVNLGAVELSYETTDALAEYTIEWAYQYWESAGVTS